MSSLRQFAGLRSALRAVTISRPTASLRVTAVSRVAAARGFAPIATRAFSASVVARSDAASGVPSPLAAKLADEINYEQEENAQEQTPEFLKAFKEQGVWAIEENTGSDEVTLTRKFGNEQIKIVFSISDVDQSNEDEFPQEDEQGEVEEDQAYSYPIRTSITITKTTSNGALVIDALAQDGAFLCDSIAYYSDAATAQSNGAEADWTRRGLYFGPQFEQLDVAVQEEFERYLNERGIDESLALFIPDFAEYKEQKEYLKWLNGVHDFIKA